jgi:hypothetical protein
MDAELARIAIWIIGGLVATPLSRWQLAANATGAGSVILGALPIIPIAAATFSGSAGIANSPAWTSLQTWWRRIG